MAPRSAISLPVITVCDITLWMCIRERKRHNQAWTDEPHMRVEREKQTELRRINRWRRANWWHRPGKIGERARIVLKLSASFKNGGTGRRARADRGRQLYKGYSVLVNPG